MGRIYRECHPGLGALQVEVEVPAVIQDATGTAAASATVLTLPHSMSAPVTGYIILEGY